MCFTTSFLSVTWLAEQGSKAEKGKEHLFLPLHGAQPAVGAGTPHSGLMPCPRCCAG